MENTDTPQIDHNLYSRQIGAFGVEAMGKLIKLRVFIQGASGVSIIRFESPGYTLEIDTIQFTATI
jgi:hypothetical protein